VVYRGSEPRYKKLHNNRNRLDMKAKIKENAVEIFFDKNRKLFPKNRPIPKTYRDFIKLLRELQGKTFKVIQQYKNRIVLQYDKPKIKENGTRIVAIDLDIDLVEFV